MPPFSSSKVTLESSNSKKDDYSGYIKDDYIGKKSTKSDDNITKETEKHQSTSHSLSEGSDHGPLRIVWRNVIIFAIIHLASLYGVYLMFTSAMWQTNVFVVLLYYMSGLGVTAGAHRLWSHRSYKAKFPLRLILAFLFTIAFENDIYEWSRDHRVHHKFSETHADPHNAKRGFFFSHVGWLLCKKHPEVVKKGKTVDFSDLMEDPIVRFHRKYYIWLVLLSSFILPTIVPMYIWNETFSNSLFVATFFRLCLVHNLTWLVNSAAHMWGNRPYDVHINPRENAFVVLGAIGEGFHNYHHTFPYDYATSEYGFKYNITTAFIDLMAFFGLAYDRKTVLKSVVEARKMRTGIGSLKKTNVDGNDSLKSE